MYVLRMRIGGKFARYMAAEKIQKSAEGGNAVLLRQNVALNHIFASKIKKSSPAHLITLIKCVKAVMRVISVNHGRARLGMLI